MTFRPRHPRGRQPLLASDYRLLFGIRTRPIPLGDLRSGVRGDATSRRDPEVGGEGEKHDRSVAIWAEGRSPSRQGEGTDASETVGLGTPGWEAGHVMVAVLRQCPPPPLTLQTSPHAVKA